MANVTEVKNWLTKLSDCSACPLREEGNRGPTRFTGSISSPLMIIGEGPGGVEDIYGVPLVGPSGQLLDKALWSIGLTRDKIYVTNIVKCRPKANRTPLDSEGRYCADLHLTKEIDLIKPKVIITLGKVALHYFNNDEGAITKMRGHWLNYHGIPVMPTFHPAYLLRLTGKELVAAKWNVFYDLKAAFEKAKELSPDYEYGTKEMPNLLLKYEPLKKQRQF